MVNIWAVVQVKVCAAAEVRQVEDAIKSRDARDKPLLVECANAVAQIYPALTLSSICSSP